MVGSSFSRFVARLEQGGYGPKHSGNQVLSKCPAHEDYRPSLSIANGRDRTLVHCFAGCSPSAVANAVGLNLSDLFDAPTSSARPSLGSDGIVATYPYHDENGTLLSEVVRLVGKKFRQRRPVGVGEWDYSLKGVRRVLYRLPEVLAAMAAGQPVYVVEGEKDADRLCSLGITATTAAGGASAPWKPEYADTLRGAKVILVGDNDEPGRQHVRKVSRALRGVAASVRSVELPNLGQKGDVSDWLDAGRNADDFRAICEAAPINDPAATDQLKESEADPRYCTLGQLLRDPDIIGLPTPLLPRLAWPGRVSMLSAREKAGKSTLAGVACAAYSSTGQFLGETVEPGVVLYYGFEEHQGDLARRLADAGADLDGLLVVQLLPTTLTELRELIEDVRPSVVVIDTLSRMAMANRWAKDENDAGAWTPIMAELCDIARDTNCAMLLLHHSTKANNGQYRGSTAIGAGVDMLISMTTRGDVEPLSSQDDGTRILIPKGRWPAERCSLKYVNGTYLLVEGTPGLTQRIRDVVRQEPGLSRNAVVERSRANRKAALAEIERLAATHQLIDRGNGSASALYLADPNVVGQIGAGSDTTDTSGGTACAAEAA